MTTPMTAPAWTDWDRDAALTTAKILLEIKAVNFRPEEPYTLTSGWKSPVYIDCRRIIYFPRARAKICELAVEKIGAEQIKEIEPHCAGIAGIRVPTTGIADCCARATTGHAAAPPRTPRNSRRLMSVPRLRREAS